MIGCAAGGSGAFAKRQPQKLKAVNAAAPDTRTRFVMIHHAGMVWLVDYRDGGVKERVRQEREYGLSLLYAGRVASGISRATTRSRSTPRAPR